MAFNICGQQHASVTTVTGARRGAGYPQETYRLWDRETGRRGVTSISFLVSTTRESRRRCITSSWTKRLQVERRHGSRRIVSMSAVTDWLTAIGTCGAVIVSLGLALREIRARRKQEEQEQAEQITAWLVPLPDAYRDQYPSETCMGIRVHNPRTKSSMT